VPQDCRHQLSSDGAGTEIGRDFGDSAEIVAGLSSADRVIDSPPETLQSGDQVQLVPTSIVVATCRPSELRNPKLLGAGAMGGGAGLAVIVGRLPRSMGTNAARGYHRRRLDISLAAKPTDELTATSRFNIFRQEPCP
jgi:hypothetical protein